MADDVMKYLTGVDPYASQNASNPFAEGEQIATAETPFADELPFRFTQFAINPSSKATAGQTGRTAVARSPYTSGALASELRDIRDRLGGMGGVSDPGAMPEAPKIPDMIPAETTDPGRSVGFSEEDTGIQSGLQGLPTKEYQLPSNIMLEGMNPIYAAQQFEKYKDKLSPEELAALGPMQSISGYDMKATLGEEEYGNWFGDKTYEGGENQATQRMYKNLSMLPSTVDPGFGKTKNELNLATRDFSYNPYQYMSREQTLAPQVDNRVLSGGADTDQVPVEPTLAEPDGIQRLGESGLYFDPTGASEGTFGNTDMDQFTANVTKDLSSDQHNKNALTRGINAALVPAILAFMSYGVGSGIAGLGAAGAGVGAGAGTGTAVTVGVDGIAGSTALAASAPTATGAAGLLSMNAGLGASAVNFGTGVAGSMAATKIAEKLGVDVSNPQVQMLMAAIAGGTAGYMSGGPTAKGQDLYKTAEYLKMSDSEFASQILSGENGQFNSIAEYIEKQPEMLNSAIDKGEILSNTTNLGSTQVSSAAFRLGAPGFDQLPGSDLSNPVMGDVSRYGLKTGLGIAEGAATNANMNSVSGMVEDPAAMAQYNTDYESYQQMLDKYNTELAQYEEMQRLQSDYETKMAEFAKRSGDWKTYTGLKSKQQGITSQIAGNISENPYYDAPENYIGVQSDYL